MHVPLKGLEIGRIQQPNTETKCVHIAAADQTSKGSHFRLPFRREISIHCRDIAFGEPLL